MSTIRNVVPVPVSVRAHTTRATRLHVTTATATHRSSFKTFAVIVGGLIVALSAMLMTLNTMLVHGAFAVQAMQTQNQDLQRQQQALADAVAYQESPAQLAQRAATLGMKPAVNPVFLKLEPAVADSTSHGTGGDSTTRNAVAMSH